MTKKESGRRGVILLSVSILSAAAAVLAVQGMVRSVLSASSFLVTELEVQWPSEMKRPADRYKLNSPVPIFNADLGAVAQLLRQKNPLAEIEAVRRILPNRIVATMRQRRVVMQVWAQRYYPVSDEGTVTMPGQAVPWPHLPIIFLDGVRGSFKVGDTFAQPQFWKAYELLAAVHRQGGIAGLGVNSIRCKGQDIALVLDSGLEIRFSGDDVSAGWSRLAGLLSQKPAVLAQARYLDLRFEDPVIGGIKKTGKDKH